MKPSFDLHEDVSAASLIMTLTLLLVITSLLALFLLASLE